jgi:hypothetical protein
MRNLILFILLISNVSAEEMIICASYYAYRHKPYVESLEGSDKLKHCTMSCAIANTCNDFETYQLGLIKEIVDLFTPGDADLNDIKANIQGIKLSRKHKFSNIYQCHSACKRYY